MKLIISNLVDALSAGASYDNEWIIEQSAIEVMAICRVFDDLIQETLTCWHKDN